MSKLTREQVLKLAALSKLELTEEEVALFQGELSSILAYVEQLDEVDTAGLKPTYQVTDIKSRGRKDTLINYQADPNKMVEQAPRNEDGYVVVGRMI